MQAFSSVGQVIILLLAVIIILGVGFLVWKRALLDIQQRAMGVQSEVIAAYETRIKQLEDASAADAKERAEMRTEIDKVRGEVRGQRNLALEVIELIAETRVCLVPECANRITPTI